MAARWPLLVVSFAAHFRRALDPSEPSARRQRALAHAVESYSWLTHTSFDSVFAALAARHGFHRDGRPPERLISAVAADLDEARRGYLAALARYTAFRRLQAAQGCRGPRRELWAALRGCVTLGTIR
jgi:hypothetical protein